MDLKTYVRRGHIDEAPNYRNIYRMDFRGPEHLILLLEGKCRRKLLLRKGRYLYENYYAEAFIGLEDFLLGEGRPGAVGVYPGAHYILWDAEDFKNAISIQPELARRAIMELSRRVRVYDARKHTTDLNLRSNVDIEVGKPDAALTTALYEMSFAADDEFPPHLVSQLARDFKAGQALMRQGEKTSDLYIILHGELDIFVNDGSGPKKIDELGAGDMVGEMAQFDGLPRSADVLARTTVRALVFEAANFHMLFQLHPRWTQKLLTTLAERIEQRRAGL